MFVKRLSGKEALRRQIKTLEDNIKKGCLRTEMLRLSWIKLPQDILRQMAFVNTVIKLKIPQK